MSNVAQIRWKIRKALEFPLGAAMSAAMPPIPVAWPNLEFDSTKVVEYANFNVSFAPSRPLEMGPTPRIVASGSAIIVVRTRESSGADRADTIAGIIGAAYPYNAALVRDGISVIISTVDVVQGAPDPPWWMVPLNVNWTVWNNP